MKKLEGITISTMDTKRGIAVDTHFTNLEALMLAGLVVWGTATVMVWASRLGVIFVEKIKERI